MLKKLTPVMSGKYFTLSYKHVVNSKSSCNPYAKKEYKIADYANTEYLLYSRLIFGKMREKVCFKIYVAKKPAFLLE